MFEVIYDSSGNEYHYKDGDLHNETGPAVIEKDSYGLTIKYFYNGKLHRDNGPAVQCSQGNNLWFKHGMKHRLDGPAIILSDGTLEYWYHDMRHNDNGPAILYIGKTSVYYYFDSMIECSSNEEFFKKIKLLSVK